MATTTVPVERDAGLPPVSPGRALPPRVLEAINGAGFPSEAGDPTQLFRYASLDAQSPTVSHFLKNGHVSPFGNLGMAIQRATLAMNRAENPAWGMRTIGGEFLVVDPERLASLPTPVREAVRAALGRLTSGLGGTPTGPVDTMERRAPTTAPNDRGPPRAAIEPPVPATRRNTGAPLPEHPALDGISDGYRAWLARGQHRMETVEALLGQRPDSFEAGLTAVQQRYGLGTPGRPANLEAAAQAVQTELAVPGRPDGKFGRVSTPFLRNARERYGEQLATPAGRNTLRTELAEKPNLLSAISDQLGADRQAAEPLEAVPHVAEPALPEPQPLPVPVPAAQPVANPWGDLATLRQSQPAQYAERRSRILDGARNDPQAMARLFREAFTANRDIAVDLAGGWLEAENAPSRRTFATLVGQDSAVTAALPAELNDRLGRVLAPIAPSQGLFTPPTGLALTALRAYEGNRVARATSLDAMMDDDRDRYATLMWASPAAVAAAVTRLATGHPEVADAFGATIASHLQGGGPVGTLDGRVDAAYALFQPLQGEVRAGVDKGMRGMGHALGINFFGIEDRLTDRVTVPR